MNNSAFVKRDLFDWLDDLCVRFIVNLPLEELAEAERICFQIEEAQWFYEDFIRPLDPEILPALNLRNFYMLICRTCPILCEFAPEQHAEAFERFLKYKTRVPVRGAIMLNEAMDAVVLVKGWKKNANWSFPRGKINKEEPDLTCALREVYEETGYDLEAAGLVEDGANENNVEVTMREQSLKLFVFQPVPMDTHFEPRTRKEISKIQWYKLSELPTIKKNKQNQEKGEALANNANKFYMVAPFLGQLKKWIAQQRKLNKSNSNNRATPNHPTEVSVAATDVEDHVEEGMGARGDIDRLLDAHRQKKKVIPQQAPSDLPEVFPHTAQPGSVPPTVRIDPAHGTDVLNKIDLLAILKGSKASSQELPPQTPAAQLIEEPLMPPSPLHYHLSRMPTLPMAQPLTSMESQIHEVKTTPTNLPQVRAVPPPAEPGRLVPQARRSIRKGKQAMANVQGQAFAPYQQTGDSQFATKTSQVGNHGPPTPPASSLPTPILTQQKANLLDLFKKGKMNDAPQATIAAAAPAPTSPRKMQDVTLKPSTVFVPPQLLSRSSTEKANTTQSMTGQKANLLAIFKTPNSSMAAQRQDKSSSLQPSSAPVELSAFPSPGHSREASQTEPEVQKDGLKGLIAAQKRPHPAASQQSPPVSATINGPLKIPQFDMVAKRRREAKGSGRMNGSTPKKPPVTILPRPGNSDAPAIDAPPSPALAPIMSSASELTKSSLRKQKPNHPKQLITPVKTAQPPTPNLEAQSTPPKAFHPQILKRPIHLLNDHNDMSPIQPLPSPKQAIPEHRLSQKVQSTNADHKRSLLSLFTTPSSHLISPSSTVTPGLEDSLASLVSPISEYRGAQSGLQRQASWNESKSTAAIDQSQNSTASHAINGMDVDLSKDRSRKALPTISSSSSIIGHAEKAKKANPTISNGKREPESNPTARETPNELRNLLLGRLANIKF